MRYEFSGKALELVSGDITKQTTDAIVNAANSALAGGGGVDGAIHRGGGPAILEACQAIIGERGRLPAGQAVATTAGRLPVKHVVHTVGPFWSGGGRGEAETLSSCYRESLALADSLGLGSIAFPSISTGAYRYPLAEAAGVAVAAALEGLRAARSITLVRFVLFDAKALAAYEAALQKA